MRKCFHDGADLLAAARPAAHRLDRLREQGLRVHEEGGANAGTGSEGYGFASSEVAAAVLRAEAAHFRRARRRLLLRRKPLLQPPPPALGTHKCYNAAAVVNFVGGSGSGVIRPCSIGTVHPSPSDLCFGFFSGSISVRRAGAALQ